MNGAEAALPASFAPGRIMTTLVCFALKEEASPFQKLAAGRSGVDVLLVGIGRANAERALRQRLAGERPDQVFTCGFAGALNPELKLAEVIFEPPPDATREALATACRLTAAGAKPARFFCADRVATTAVEKQKLRADTGADAVEMESAAIHALCRERGIPCVTVRVISDTAGEDLPLDFNALSKPDKNLDPAKLAWAIARSPGKISALLALQRQTRSAANALAATLAQTIFG
jgi:adenosylhomocysteine nucleosidase